MLTVAIIGCGVIASTHVTALGLDGRSRVGWVCDPDLAKAMALQPSARATADWREALADPAVDLVCICSPHARHAEQVLAALAARKHVLCEKPLATDPADVERMVAAADAAARLPSPLVASAVFQHRFNPLVARLRQLVADGEFGEVRRATMDFRCTRPRAYYRSSPWRGRWEGEGGSLLINQAIHTIDLVNGFCGEPVAVSGSVERRLLGDAIECEDWAKARVRYAGGAEAELLAANDQTTAWQTEITVQGTRGSFALGAGYGLTGLAHPSQVVHAELRAIDRIRDEVVKLPGKAEYGDHHALQIADVIGAIVANRRPRVTIADAAASAHVVLGIYGSSARGGAVIGLPARVWARPTIATGPTTVLQGA
jgi:UDP-N-acetyl-2-amino-2-deoxyglucuronate dehydrogenase